MTMLAKKVLHQFAQSHTCLILLTLAGGGVAFALVLHLDQNIRLLPQF